MSVAPCVFVRLEAAAESRMYSDGVKIIRGYDAAGRNFGAVAMLSVVPMILVTMKESMSVQLLCRSRTSGRKCLSARTPRRRSSDCKQLLLMSHRRIRAEEDSFDPAENGGIRANA